MVSSSTTIQPIHTRVNRVMNMLTSLTVLLALLPVFALADGPVSNPSFEDGANGVAGARPA